MSRNSIITADSIKYKKDCRDFGCLKDGTVYGDYKYCNLSRVCRQVDVVNGEIFPMESHYCPVVDKKTGEVVEWEYYCTGIHDSRHISDRLYGDDEVN
jgi:hypothetical protein